MLNRNDDGRKDKKKQEEKGEGRVVLRVHVCVCELRGVYLRTMVFLKKLKSL